ncbi:MAG: leucine-rich repeat protein [Bacteroidaceae bacterium]|nr:leucine-rich repeat protein [Bacteroidaceae bacterium]
MNSSESLWIDEFGVQYSMDKTSRIKAPDTLVEYVIKEGTTRICEFAFVGCNDLTKVSMPDSVKEIESGAFEEYIMSPFIYEEDMDEFCTDLLRFAMDHNYRPELSGRDTRPN